MHTLTETDLVNNPGLVTEGLEANMEIDLKDYPEFVPEAPVKTPAATTTQGDFSEVTFTIRNVGATPSTRVFSKDTVGDDFMSLADQFEASNTRLDVPVRLSDLSNKSEVDKIEEFNRTVTHPILSRVNE